MKKFLSLIFVLSLLFACETNKKADSQTIDVKSDEMAYASFGDKIDADNALSTQEIATKYENLKVGDTLVTKMSGTINEVCSTKGCWMKLDLGDEKEVMVRFKDYGFFMPLNAEGDVIINGKAFITETSVEDLRHYAEDADKSEEEIAAITEPERTLAFEADGVLLKQE